MPSLIQRILSLTIIIFFSLAYSDGFDVKAGDVAQPLMETPGADTLDRLGNPTLGLEATGEADDWGKIADTNYGSTRQAVVAEPNNHGCSNTNGRRREIGESCPFNGAPLELRPFSAQERKSTSGEQLRKARSRKKGAIPGSPATPGPTRDPNCPPGSWAVCGASDLIHDFLNPGTYHEVPWPLDNIPSIIEVQHFCRFWYPENQCDTAEGRELPMCCKRVELRSDDFLAETLAPFTRAFMLQYPNLGFFCEPLAGIPLLP